jgi:hypothetical protein
MFVGYGLTQAADLFCLLRSLTIAFERECVSLVIIRNLRAMGKQRCCVLTEKKTQDSRVRIGSGSGPFFVLASFASHCFANKDVCLLSFTDSH